MKKWWMAVIMAVLLLFSVAVAEENTTFYAFEAYTVCRVNLREGPDVTYHKVQVLPEKTAVRVVGECNGWWKVQVQNVQGYIRQDLICKGTEERYVGTYNVSYGAYTTARVNFRKRPNLEARVLEVLPENTPVTVVGIAVDWLQVSYDGKTGYIFSKYLSEYAPEKQEEASECYIATTNVFMRMGPGKEYDALTMLHGGQEVTFLKKKGNWYFVEYKGITGYVYSQYLIQK